MPLYRQEFDDVLLPFLDGMRYKMSNSKRWHGTRTWETTSPEELLKYLKGEVAELEEALREGSDLEVFLECVDVANVAMMVSDSVRKTGRSIPNSASTETRDVAEPGILATCPHGFADRSYCRECQHPGEPVSAPMPTITRIQDLPIGSPSPELLRGRVCG